MKVTCSGCGDKFEAKRASAKYCSDRCRQRGRRGSSKKDEPIGLDKLLAMLDEAGVSINPDQLDLDDFPSARRRIAGEDEDPIDREPPLLERTRADLEKAKKLDTAEGQQLLIIAARMHRMVDTGSAISSLSKEYSRLRTRVLPSSQDEVDPIDEVGRRRAEKAARAAQA